MANKKELLDLELEKLQQQVKLMNQLAGLYANQAKYIDDANKRAENHERILRKIAELRRNGVVNIKSESDLDMRRLELEQRRLEIYQSLEDITDDIAKKEEESFKNRIKRAKEYKKEQEDIEKLEKKAEDRRRQIASQKRNQNVKDSTLNKRFNEDEKLNNILNEIKRKKNEQVNGEYINDAIKQIKIGNSNLGKYVELNEKGISTKALALQAVVDTFNKAVQVFSDSVKKGFQNQTGSYENNFTNIAVRTGMSQSTYRNNQMKLGGFGASTLGDMGLSNNIRTSDVQNMWNTLSERGFSQEDVLVSSLETVITSTLVPYLDVTTTEMQLFNQNVGNDGLLKQVRGISKIAQEEYDNNIVATQYLQDQLNYLAPMSSVAEIDLMKSTATGQFMLQSMLDEGMSLDSIAELQRNTRIIQDDVYGALNSSNLSVQLGAMNAVKNNVNTYTDYGGTLNSLVGSTTDLAKLYPSDSFQSSIISSSWGMNGRSMYEISQLIKQGKLSNLDADFRKAQQNASNLGIKGQEVTNSLANDEFHTTRQLTDILAENLTNEVSAFAEMLGPWFDVITTALKGIAAVVGIKLVGKLGGKLLGIGGSSGGSAAGGLIGNSLTAFAGTGLGYRARGVGASMGIKSVPAATAAGIALPAAIAAGGVAGGVYGVSEGVKDLQNDHKVRGGISTAGGVAMAAGGIGVAGGMLAAGAANAWNPVGWALLIGGAVAVAGTALHRYAEEQEKAAHATGDIMDQLNEQSKLELESYKKESKQKLDQLETIKERLEGTDNLEAQKQILEEAGIASKQELQKEEYNNKEALMALTDQYIASTKTETEELNNTREELYKNRDALLNDASKGIFAMKNSGYDALTKEQKAALPELGRKYYAYLEANKDKDKHAKWRYNKINEKIEKGEINLNDDITSQADYDAIFWQGDIKDQTELWERITSSKDFMKGLSEGDYGNTVRKGIGMNYAATLDYNYAAEQLQAALNVRTEESAQSIMTHLAVMGFNRDNLKSDMLTKVLEKYPNISFRVGTDSIPYDNYPALLHEGEAVLTASTANELRSLVDEYRETKNESTKLEKAIQDQTMAICERLDAIYSKIPTDYESNPNDIMPGNINGSGGNLAVNMRSMKSPFAT